MTVEALSVNYPVPGSFSCRTDASGLYTLQPSAGSGYEYWMSAGGRHYSDHLDEHVFFPNPGVNYFYVALEPTDGKAIVTVDGGASAVVTGQVPFPHCVVVRVFDPDSFLAPGTFLPSQDSGPGQVSFRVSNNMSNYSCFCIFPAFGVYQLKFTYQDGYGDVGFTTAVVTVLPPDTTPPAVPSVPDLDPASDTGVSNTDNITSDNTPTFNVTAQAGVIITIYSDGSPVGSGSGGIGVSYSVTTSPLPDGVHMITATATDGAGNESAQSGALAVTIDTTLTGNECPVVHAGPDMTTEARLLPWSVALAGSASDPDNGPQPLTITWSKVSGPGTVSFLNEHDPRTTARFDAGGTYVLELSCSDGECVSTSTVRVEVEGGTAGSVCDPLAHWDFEEGSGLVAHDVSGNGHDGQLMGGAGGGPAWVAGYDGGALQFDGRDDYVDTGITENLAKWTICCWVSSPAAPAAGPSSGPMQREQNFQMNWNHTDPAFRSAAALKVAGAWHSASFGPLAATTWYHLAATYDGVSLKAYRNGELITTTSCPGTAAAEGNSLKLARHAAAPQFFAGTVDEAYVYPCALSQDEIKALMTGSVMTVREVIDNGWIGDELACYASLNSGGGTVVNYTTDVLDIYDSGARGHFNRDKPFGVVVKGLCTLSKVDNLSMRVDGVLRIPSGQGGDWTFGVSSDDGFTLMLPGHDFSSVTNGELAHLAEGTAIRFPGGRSRADTLGVINLPAGGYPFWLTYHECVGEAEVELFAARGAQTAFDPEPFRLVGQRNIGKVGVPGFCEEVTMLATKPGGWSGGAISSIADARAALALVGRTVHSVTCLFVNHVDPDTFSAGSGMFAGELPFPNDVVGKDDDDFAVRVTGLLDIPADGVYQIGFDSDDGASLRIMGESWQSIVADGTGKAVIAGDELVNDVISSGTFTVGQIVLTAGCHAFEAVMFERSAGSHFVLFGRGVSDWGIPDPTWHLLRAGGASASVDVRGLQLVNPVGTP